jgi:GC-rich sequence DNA-binding factor
LSSTAAAAAEPEAVQQYKRRRQEVLDVAPTVFADADEQFASLAAVKTKLEDFKRRYPKEYSTAYLGESAAALFAPFVRLELLQWQPLPLLGSSSSGSSAAVVDGQQQSDPAPSSFDAQSWYLQLFEYGLLPPLSNDDAAAAAAAVGPGDDADSSLVPQLVESLILPLALNLVAK